MDLFGLLSGILTLLIIGTGFPLVIFTERWLGYLWWPYMMGLGFAIGIASLFINNDGLCVVVAILGVTLIWGSTELKEQAIRAELGWYPFNAHKIKPPFASTITRWKAPHL